MVRLGAYLTTPVEIEREKSLFKKELCLTETETAECHADIDRYWPPIADAIFSFSETPKDICAVTDSICTKSADECGECVSFLVSFTNSLDAHANYVYSWIFAYYKTDKTRQGYLEYRGEIHQDSTCAN